MSQVGCAVGGDVDVVTAHWVGSAVGRSCVTGWWCS